MKRKRNGGRREGAGRPNSATSAVISVRVSLAHKERFEKLLTTKERRVWLEGVIDIEASLAAQET